MPKASRRKIRTRSDWAIIARWIKEKKSDEFERLPAHIRELLDKSESGPHDQDTLIVAELEQARKEGTFSSALWDSCVRRLDRVRKAETGNNRRNDYLIDLSDSANLINRIKDKFPLLNLTNVQAVNLGLYFMSWSLRDRKEITSAFLNQIDLSPEHYEEPDTDNEYVVQRIGGLQETDEAEKLAHEIKNREYLDEKLLALAKMINLPNVLSGSDIESLSKSIETWWHSTEISRTLGDTNSDDEGFEW